MLPRALPWTVRKLVDWGQHHPLSHSRRQEQHPCSARPSFWPRRGTIYLLCAKVLEKMGVQICKWLIARRILLILSPITSSSSSLKTWIDPGPVHVLVKDIGKSLPDIGASEAHVYFVIGSRCLGYHFLLFPIAALSFARKIVHPQISKSLRNKSKWKRKSLLTAFVEEFLGRQPIHSLPSASGYQLAWSQEDVC